MLHSALNKNTAEVILTRIGIKQALNSFQQKNH